MKLAKGIELVLDRPAKGGSTAVYLVKRNGNVAGLLEKYNNTRTETHPWKAYRGIGQACKYQGAFYENEGGKQAALDAVLA